LKAIILLIKQYQQQYFDWKLYLSILVFLVITTSINFYVDFEDNFIDPFDGTWWKGLWMFLFHAFPFLTICGLLYITGKNREWLHSGEFWLKVLVAFGVVGLFRSFQGYGFLLEGMDGVDVNFLTRPLHRVSGLLTVVLPFILFYLFLEKDRDLKYYGLKLSLFDPKPYLTLLAIVAVFISIGSFEAGLQRFYPFYRGSGGDAFAQHHQVSELVPVFIYELGYGINFIYVEYIFRGFLVLAFARILGGYAVLAMVGTYMFLHYGKPLAEAISSVFGAYLLGIISLHTRKIWGGVIIHVGVAWLMELLGYLQA